MPFHVELQQPVIRYIEQVEGLTPNEQFSIAEGVIAELSEHADRFLAGHPIAHESLAFHYDYYHLTHHPLFNFDFVVDASSFEMGVVRVVYAECTTEPIP